MKNRSAVSAFLNRPEVMFVWRTTFMFSALYLVVCAGAALAQSSAPTWDLGCKIVQFVGQPNSRMFGAIAGGMIAIVDMGRHSQNFGNWMREHWGTALAAGAIIAIPSILSFFFGNNCGLQ